MISNPLKIALLERKVTFGGWIQLGHPGIAEILANAGFEWIAADCEHTDIGIESFTNLARAMHGRNTTPMARVRENDSLSIRQVLDAGAQGVIVPFVNTADDAKKAVASAKFPPVGIRGFAFFRANDWGVRFDDYANDMNNEISVIAMIESRCAVQNIDEILDVDGIDGVFIGPYDMTGSYGITGQISHPVIKDACTSVVSACKNHGKSAGIHIVKPTDEAIERSISQGFTFICLGMDTVFLDLASRDALGKAYSCLNCSK